MTFETWKDDSAYAYFDDLDVSGWAWECLRRNSAYADDYRAELGGAGGMTARWNLRFPGRP